jgi:ribose/xylose/arabinose/galactoside ABC-type transport system permease subunit
VDRRQVDRRLARQPEIALGAGVIGVSPLGWLVLALLLAGGWLLSRTAFGRDFYAVG